MKVGLVLGAGGARGFAHIGALQALEEASVELTAVVGASMGGVVGAMAAAGLSAATIRQTALDRSRLRLPSPGKLGGLIGHHGFLENFCDDLPECIEGLDIPFAVVAVDIANGELVVLSQGPLKPALAATVAIPGILSPEMIEGRPLVDGGVLNALPVDLIGEFTDHPVIAIDVTPPSNRPLPVEPDASWWQRMWTRLSTQRRPLSADLFLKAFALQQMHLNEARLQEFPPALCVRPALDPGLRLEDFHRMEEAVQCGYRATREALSDFDG